MCCALLTWVLVPVSLALLAPGNHIATCFLGGRAGCACRATLVSHRGLGLWIAGRRRSCYPCFVLRKLAACRWAFVSDVTARCC